MAETGITIQDLLQVYQTINGQFDTYLTFTALIATVFGIIVAIVIALFTIRQINVDREIRKYKKGIQEEREAARKIRIELQKTFLQTTNWLGLEKEKIEKEAKTLSDIPRDRLQKLERLEERIDGLREKVAFQEGIVSTASSTSRDGVFSSAFGETIVCKQCGVHYKVKTNPNFVLQWEESKCPVCRYVNGLADYYNLYDI